MAKRSSFKRCSSPEGSHGADAGLLDERRKARLEEHKHLMGFTKIDPGGGSPFKEIGRLLRPGLR